MSELDDSIVSEFLADTREGLARYDHDLVALERQPSSPALLASVFRTLHTIKGTCSFLGFTRLQSLSHAGEGLLARLRGGELTLTPAIVSALLATGDSLRDISSAIEATRAEPPGDDSALVRRLEALRTGAETAPAESAAMASAVGDAASSLRVDVRSLDSLVTLVGELVLTRNRLSAVSGRHDDDVLAAVTQRMDAITTALQQAALATRMQPVSALWSRLPRLARDTALACGKSVRLEMDGAHTELDRTLVEALRDPLVHLVRNAVDHGIEAPPARAAAGKPAQGRLQLRAWHEGGMVHLELADDGAGLPLARIRERALASGLVTAERSAGLDDAAWANLIFEPGFSTAAAVTSVSGRGVGMDVVRTALQSIGGVIEVDSRPGVGTCMRMRVPLTLAILPALVVEDGGEHFAVPHAHVAELVRVPNGGLDACIEWTLGGPAFRLRGRLLPVVFLSQALGGVAAAAGAARRLLVLRAEERAFALVVGSVLDTEEIVVKPLHRRLRRLAMFSGATVRGDGSVALILDVAALARLADAPVAPAAPASVPKPAHTLLLLTSRPGDRVALLIEHVARIEEFAAECFECPGDRPALRWNDEVLPVAPLSALRDSGARLNLEPGRHYPVAVHEHEGRRYGFVAESVDDVVQLAHAPRDGRVLVGGKVTDVLDLPSAIARLFPRTLPEAA